MTQTLVEYVDVIGLYSVNNPKAQLEVCKNFLALVDILFKFYPKDAPKQYNQLADKLNHLRKY